MTQATAVFKVHIGTVIAWRKRYKTTGNIERKVRRPVKKKIILEKRIEYMQEHPILTLKKLRKYLAAAPHLC